MLRCQPGVSSRRVSLYSALSMHIFLQKIKTIKKKRKLYYRIYLFKIIMF